MINIYLNKKDQDNLLPLLEEFNIYYEKIKAENSRTNDVLGKYISKAENLGTNNVLSKYIYKSQIEIEEDIKLIETDPDDINYLVDLIMQQTSCKRIIAIKTLRECKYDLVETLIKL